MRPRLLIGSFVVFAVVAAAIQAALAPPRAAAPDDRVSSTNAQPNGARGLSLWLRAFGYPTRSFRGALTSLDDGVRALAVLHPTQAITPRQADALFEWVAAGGTLLLAPGDDLELETRLERFVTLVDDATRAADVRGDRVVPDSGQRWRYRESGPREGGAYPYPVAEVAVRGTARVTDPTFQHSILFERDGLGLAAEIFHGEGMILLFPEASPLTNRGLAKADNVALVAGLVEEWIEPGTEIWFDEYDHGARVAASPLAYFARRRPGLFALAFLATGALSVARFGRALVTRADGPGTRMRRRPTEFVEALGGLYARAHAVEPAWTALAETARRLEEGRGALAARAALVSRTGAERDRSLAAVAAARHRAEPNESELRRLAEAISEACRGDGAAGPTTRSLRGEIS